MTSLQCPYCHLVLTAHIENDVEIDVCDQCHGVWLDHGELETISNGEDFLAHRQASERLDRLRCPRCDTDRFSVIEMEEGVLAQCGECRGLFVEGPIIERVAKLRPTRTSEGRTLKAAADVAEVLWWTHVLGALFGEL